MVEPRHSFGPFVLDAGRGLLRNGKSIAVGQRGLALLEALLDAEGEVVTKADLMERAWPGTIVEEGNLTVQIAALRKLLGTTRDGLEWIATVPRVGYRLVRPGAGSREMDAGSRPDRPWRSCLSPASAATPGRTGSPTAWWTTSSPRSAGSKLRGDRPQLIVRLQGPHRRRPAGGARSRRSLRAGRQRAARRRSAADYRAAGRRHQRRASVGRAFRRRGRGHLRLPGPNHRARRGGGRAAYPVGGSCPLTAGTAGKHRGLRHLSAGAGQKFEHERQRQCGGLRAADQGASHSNPTTLCSWRMQPGCSIIAAQWVGRHSDRTTRNDAPKWPAGAFSMPREIRR